MIEFFSPCHKCGRSHSLMAPCEQTATYARHRDRMSNPGLRIESAASVTARDMIQKHLTVFAHVVRTDRVASASTAGEYINGMAGVAALTITGGLGSREEVIEGIIKQLRIAIDRDLQMLATS